MKRQLVYYEQYVALEQNDSISLYNLGICYEWLEKPERAIFYYKKYLEMEPNADDVEEVKYGFQISRERSQRPKKREKENEEKERLRQREEIEEKLVPVYTSKYSFEVEEIINDLRTNGIHAFSRATKLFNEMIAVDAIAYSGSCWKKNAWKKPLR